MQPHHQLAPGAADDIVERDGFRAAGDDADLHVILQVAADARRIQHDLDAVALEQIGGTDAGELQQLRRVIGAAGNQDLFCRARGLQHPALLVFDRHRAAPFEHNALRQCRGLDPQIAPPPRRAKIGPRRARPPPAPRRGLKPSGAFLGGAIEVGIFRNAGFGRSLDEGVRQRIRMPRIRHRQRPAAAVKFIRAALLIFRRLEIRQHVVEPPSGIAELPPAVVILVLAAHIEQPVDRTRPAQHFSARLKHGSSVQARLRLGLVHPVDVLALNSLP